VTNGILGGDQPRIYCLHGLRLRSPVPLAGFPQEDGGHDIDVCWTEWKPVPDEAPTGRLGVAAVVDGSYRYAAAAEEGGNWTLRVPALCDFLVDRNLGRVECRLDPSADPAFVAVLASGLLVAFLLGLAGHCVLHASAVELRGQGIAFAGPSGSGKSTLAALFCAAGARIVTDDVLRIGLMPDVVCVGGSTHLRLRAGARWALDHFATPPAVEPTADSRLGVTPPRVGVPIVPLSVIVLPHLSRPAVATEVRPLTGAAAVAELAAVGRVAGWIDRDILLAQFRTLAAVAAGVPVVEAVIPWGQTFGASVKTLLDQLPGHR
jgi:hypothetical protein